MLRKDTKKVWLISIKFCNFDQCTVLDDKQHQIWGEGRVLVIGHQYLAVHQVICYVRQ